jgi:hypothetical protein
MSQIFSQNLSSSAHNVAHCCLELSDCIVVVCRAIAINHDKLEVLGFFEEVVHYDAGFEVGVEAVHDLFGFANEGPMVVDQLVNHALWV